MGLCVGYNFLQEQKSPYNLVLSTESCIHPDKILPLLASTFNFSIAAGRAKGSPKTMEQ